MQDQMMDNLLKRRTVEASADFSARALARIKGSEAAGESVDYTGHRVPFVPAHTASLAADWTQRFDGTGFVRSLTVGADATGAGRIYWDEANSMSQPFYVLLGAHVDVSLARNVTLSLWSKNLTATLFDTFRFDNMNRRFAQRGVPRHFGIDVKAHFRMNKCISPLNPRRSRLEMTPLVLILPQAGSCVLRANVLCLWAVSVSYGVIREFMAQASACIVADTGVRSSFS